MSGSYRVIESFSQSLEGIRSALSQKINALSGTGRVNVGVEDVPKNSTRGEKEKTQLETTATASVPKVFNSFV